jgi:hypothetical protein
VFAWLWSLWVRFWSWLLPHPERVWPARPVQWWARRWQATVALQDVVVAQALYAPTLRGATRKIVVWAKDPGDRVSIQRRRWTGPERGYVYFTHRVGERQPDGTIAWVDAAPTPPEIPQP